MEPATIRIQVLSPDADAEDLQDLANNLREAVLDTDVDDVRLATAGRAPTGSKSGEVLSIGVLVVTLAPTVVEGLMVVVSSWLSRQPHEVEVEVDGHRFRGRVTRSQRDELVSAYLRRLDRKP